MQTNIDENKMGKFFNILNVFQKYYKELYKIIDNRHMFDDVDLEKESSTNRCMELYYEYLYEYKINSSRGEEYIELAENIDEISRNCNSEALPRYMLLIENNKPLYSNSFMSCIIYLETLDWSNIEWKITKVDE